MVLRHDFMENKKFLKQKKLRLLGNTFPGIERPFPDIDHSLLKIKSLSVRKFGGLKSSVKRNRSKYGMQEWAMGLSKSKIKKLTILVLLERSSNVEFNYLKIFVIRGHKRSLEVNKGQMEVKNQK